MEATNEEQNGPAQSSLPLNDDAAESIEAPQTAAPAKRAPRKRATTRKPAAAAAPATEEVAATVAAADPAAAETAAEPEKTAAAPAKKTARAPRTRKPAAAAASTEQASETAETEELPQKPARAPRTRKPAGTSAATAVTADTPEAASTTDLDGAGQTPDAAEAPAKTTRTRKAPARKSRAGATSTKATPAAEEADSPAAADTVPEAVTENPAADETAPATTADPFAVPDSAISVLFQAPDLAAVAPGTRATEEGSSEDGQDAGTGNRSSRRNRSRSREEAPNREERADSEETSDESGSSSRRRRRRRRGDADLELTGGNDDDPPNTVTRVRGPRAAADPAPSNKVTSVKGSTRLEAKRQRRRDSRDSGRRRHVITEAEFLARRESVDRQMVVRQRDERIQIGVLEDGVLAEHFVSKTQQDSLIGNVYVGKVQNVLPSMEAAFIDIGRGRNAVLYAGEVNWDVAGLEGQPRRIEHALKSGDPVLVQVTKDPVGHKGARLTSQISLPGRYLVYVPGGSMTGISRKLPDVERNRLKKILKDHLPQNAGVIVRTAAEGASEQELMNDINRLRAQWEEIEAKSTSTKTTPPELLYAEPDLTIKVVRDVFNEDFSKLIVSGEHAWDTIEAYVTYVAPDLLDRLEKWTSDEDIFTARRLEEQIHKALDRKVFLPSGGSLVIDRTEAMTVVDVNTGKFTGSGGNLEETVTKNNLEAAEEIVRQLRLRDIGGIIVIDFIDMVLEANRDLVLRRLVECLGRDRTKHQVAEVTSLGLVQMTRKRMGTGLLEVFSENCEACNGRGVVTHDEPVEHRRSTSQQSEQHNQKRNDRKQRGNRHGKGGDQVTDQATEPSAPEPKKHDPEAEAKAETTRAALASIAAATQASHEQTGGTKQRDGNDAGASSHGETAPVEAQDGSESGSRRRGRGRSRGRGRAGSAEMSPTSGSGEQTVETAGSASTTGGPAASSSHQPEERPQAGNAGSSDAAQETEVDRDGPVVSIAGEDVRLPRARRSRRATAPTQTPDLTLESLSAAFGAAPEPVREPAAVQPPAPAVDSAPAAQLTPAPAAQPVASTPARRPRRSRAASSAQGGANMPIERVEATSSSPEAGTSHVAKLESSEPGAKKKAAEDAPMMFGVGVPASEL
ncbi:Rne/Rng family ribonuclease [Arthrobacter rhombi]|uniref:Ribonuclease E n=1 Tax=Arthrobacter rhombi TaxID=71253 RepID=A0A1R4FW41_9MICC|nr:Rne/Rng family ribonuclease [Arthrobacter rhombi]SJM60047.1 Cytoplasmic axial filament protein CafA and Ribonuclease G [Arthrobacter rhombi]